MTDAFSGSGRGNQRVPSFPTLPSGWPIGSYDTYQEAHQAVEFLAGNEFPVQEVTIVGDDPCGPINCSC